jgi:Zn-dependent protease
MPHIRRSPFGLVVIPLLVFFMSKGGWMIGWASAPYDHRWAMRHPQRYAAMSFAGPAANFFLALVAFIAIRVLVGLDLLEFGGVGGIDALVQAKGTEGYQSSMGAVALGLSVMLSLNVLLGVFNLMPVLPLDGASVLEGLFPKQLGAFYDKVRTTGAFYFLGIVIAWQIFPYVGWPVLALAIHFLQV